MKAENESVKMLTTGGIADLAGCYTGAYAASASSSIVWKRFIVANEHPSHIQKLSTQETRAQDYASIR
ncbi:hypothetical protein KXD40_001791 [Peronospora effusa]|nr:hypothetical protein KXD40_001791 [Peronospora effusa]